jgi:hypothetical protein
MRPTVGEILADHISLEVSCVDRIYVNGYVPLAIGAMRT